MRIRLSLVLLGWLGLAGCDLSATYAPATADLENKHVHDGDAARGFSLVASGSYGCAACHAIPGIRTPKGVAGPPLAGMARRGFIAGQLPNKPGVMVAFLQDPPALLATTGMPNVGLTLDEARDVAAYLYTLEQPDAE
ncbi:c-type cytochrome [Microvirga sp. M2]|uniref:c-type cytochrome n=1 Tax=Microvirga sp. M2 TaxID=3073270 RepID=UPI0039C3F80D